MIMLNKKFSLSLSFIVTHGRVHGPISLLDPESRSPYGICKPCQL